MELSDLVERTAEGKAKKAAKNELQGRTNSWRSHKADAVARALRHAEQQRTSKKARRADEIDYNHPDAQDSKENSQRRDYRRRKDEPAPIPGLFHKAQMDKRTKSKVFKGAVPALGAHLRNLGASSKAMKLYTKWQHQPVD